MLEEVAKRPRAGARALLALPCLLCVALIVPGDQFVPRWTLALTGDVMLGRGVAQALDGNWEAAFAQARAGILGADLAFGNLESPLTTAPYIVLMPGSPPEAVDDLRGPPEAVAALEACGFDLLSLANNHALDGGQPGLLEAAATLRAATITPLPPFAPICLSVPGRTCWVAFDDSSGELNEVEAAAAVESLAENGVLVVVSIHWGGEYQADPSPRQEALAETLAAAGAGLIVGHGPHVLQRIEWLGETLVLYSLGNTLFDQPYPDDARRGAVVLVAVERGELVSVTAVPTVSSLGRVRLAVSEDASRSLTRLGLGADLETGPPYR